MKHAQPIAWGVALAVMLAVSSQFALSFAVGPTEQPLQDRTLASAQR
ncbi:hypothetical protein [Stutzerimonas urumqiensis]|nr:hypothetical protein [Stutzerimonas urumqiensis]